MGGLLQELSDKLKLRLLRRNEMESLELRRFFSDKYDINVGLYSYGCFDPWRISHHTTIGRYCSFAKTVRILNANHPIDAISTHPILYEPSLGVAPRDPLKYNHCVIEDDVWLSHNATITPGCAVVGRGSIIGAGAVVTRSVAPYSIMTGAPARVLRMRFEPDLIAALEKSKWWELDKQALATHMRQNPEAFYHPTVATLAAMTSETAKGKTLDSPGR
jgi:acetyltransferase-like isoleucine patch superfamily enzyme